MLTTATDRNALLEGIHVLDGGMATELEQLGANIDGPLWSAHVLEDFPEKVVAVHRAYIAAGADCIETASYQVSRRGYAEFGLTTEQADAALLKAVRLARTAAMEPSDLRVLVAASLGPYGAALHNGSEYYGNYDCTFEDLVSFHRERIEVLANANSEDRADLLAFETLPSLQETEAIGEALAPWPHFAAWFSYTCKDARHVAHGEQLADCARLAANFPADRRHRRQLHAPNSDSGAYRRVASLLRPAHHRLSKFGRRVGRGSPPLDRHSQPGKLCLAGQRMVCSGRTNRRRMLPHAARAYSTDR